MGNVTINGDLTGTAVGGLVGGAANLTTVGAIPYVSAAGILNQDPTALFWDAANDRLGIGTGSPSRNLHVLRNTSSQGGALLQNLSTGTIELSISSANWPTGGEYSVGLDATGAFLYVGPNAPLRFFNTGAERARFAASTGNFLIGTTTDSNFKLDVAASGSAGTARFYGGAGVSDSTRVVVRAGAGQSGDLLQIQNSAGSNLFWVNATGGASFAGSFAMATGLVALDSGLLNAGNGVKLGSGSGAYWNSTAGVGGSNPDLSLSRASAGVLQVGDGGSNANGQVSATRVLHAGVLVASLPAAAAGNAGSIQYVTDANATTIGSTVVGGGANKVMVWSDGAAWKIFAS